MTEQVFAPFLKQLCTLLTLKGVLQMDPWLEPYKDVLKKRFSKAKDWIAKIEKDEGGLEKFSRVSSIDIGSLQSLKHIGLRTLWLSGTE